MRQYDHIVWDWNGTLLDDAALCVAILNRILAQRGLAETTLEEYRAAFSFPASTIYEHLGIDLSRESFESLSRQFFYAYEKEKHTCSLHRGARPLLEHIGAHGSQSVLSAYSQETLNGIIDAFGLTPFFTHVVGVDHIYATGKSEQGRGLMALLRHPPQSILLVGDTLHDAEVARLMGVPCVLVAHGHQSRARLEAEGVKVIDSLDELYPIV